MRARALVAPELSTRPDGVTRRAVLLALALLLVFAPAGYYVEVVAAGDFASGMVTLAPLFALFLLTALNGRFGVRPFTRRELLAVYGITLLGSPLFSKAILPFLIPYNIVQQYLARAIPQWQTAYLNLTPAWFGPADPAAAENYFVGQARVPWALWWGPLAVWLSFLLAVVVCPVSLMVLLRRQWITHERLSFPIAQVPLELAQEAGDGRARLPRSWPFWIGFLIPFSVGILGLISRYAPAVPTIPFTGVTIFRAPVVGPLAALGEMELDLAPWQVAIAFLIPKDLSFSCWFFYWLKVLLMIAAISFGATPQGPDGWYESTFPAPHHQSGGAVVALTLWVLWTARRHLARALRLAFTRRGGEAQRGEAASYRLALLACLASFGYMVAFTIAAGARPFMAFLIIALILAYYVMWARMRAETGTAFLFFPLRVDEILFVPFGRALFTTREAIILYDLRWTYYPGASQSPEVITGNAVDAFKIADSARLPGRPLLTAMLVGLVLAMVTMTYAVLVGNYHYGFLNLRSNTSGWLGPQLRFIGGRIYSLITETSPLDPNAVIALVAGGVVAIGLGLLRLRFWWWPFHPIGYLASGGWGMSFYWMPFFVGWVLKSLTIRYGGLQLYRRLMPVAAGLIVGDFVSSGVSMVVTLVTGGRG